MTHGNLQAGVTADLRAEKARRAISASDMATTIGVGVDWISRRLRDQVPVSLQDLEKLCATVGVRPVVYLIPVEAPDPLIERTNPHGIR